MGYRDFPTQIMIELSADWIDPAGARAHIEEIPAAAALLPENANDFETTRTGIL